MRYPKNLDHDSWNWWLTIESASYELAFGWRRVNIGIFRLKPDIPHGADCIDHVARGVWWRFAYWLPFVWRRG